MQTRKEDDRLTYVPKIFMFVHPKQKKIHYNVLAHSAILQDMTKRQLHSGFNVGHTGMGDTGCVEDVNIGLMADADAGLHCPCHARVRTDISRFSTYVTKTSLITHN
jgi:hypothetical protein